MTEIHPAVKKLITVCRCNNIKFGTIDKVIEAGAKTIAEVAAATTATTGRCGGSCTPRVLEMIEARWAEAGVAHSPADDPEDAWWKG